MIIKSEAFGNNEPIPQKYTCDGENISPPFDISEIPEETKSLVLIADDPDAPSGDWVHWLVWNIEPENCRFLEGKAPEGAIEGVNDSGNVGYGSPCPPSGVHRYVFKIYALDITMTTDAMTKEQLESEMSEHILDQAQIIGTYSRANA